VSVPGDPVEFLKEIAVDDAKQLQWRAFLERSSITNTHMIFSDVVDDLAGFLEPPLRAVLSGGLFAGNWNAGGPWE